MGKPILFSDLDQTLIYSQNQIIKHGQTVAGNICVEQLDDKALSFTSLYSWQKLAHHAGETFHFIPVTTRTVEQFKRVVFPQVHIEYAVVLNGAKILVNGEEDPVWNKKIVSLLEQLPDTPETLFQRIEKDLTGHQEIKTFANASSAFVYVVAHNQTEMNYLSSYMSELAEETGYQISKQGRKIYLLPPDLTKGAAVAELKNRLNPSQVFSAGDTFLDYSMHAESQLFLRPFHAEAFDALENHYTTNKHGIHASEDILDTVLERIS